MDRVKPICGGDEENARKIEGNVEIVVRKGGILSRIENLEQSGGRVPTEIGTDLVNFVQKDHRIVAFDTPQALNNSAGKRADVGATVTPNFGFVTHAAECDADEFSTERVGHAVT